MESVCAPACSSSRVCNTSLRSTLGLQATRRTLQRLLRIFKLLACAYLLYALAASIFQEALIFPGQGRQFSGRMPKGAEVWTHPIDQSKVTAWFIPGRGCTSASPGPAVIYFHGNMQLIDEVIATPTYTQLGISVLLVEYRGYGDAEGTPSTRGILDDARAFRTMLGARRDVDPSRIIYHGQSLGGGFAAELAGIEPPAALILESTFTSLSAMARRVGLPGILLRHRLSPQDVLPNLDCPVLIVHGRTDAQIPFSHGEQLATLARAATLYATTDGHNDLPSDLPAYERQLGAFLQSAGILAPSP